jgi:hypothetical protein
MSALRVWSYLFEKALPGLRTWGSTILVVCIFSFTYNGEESAHVSQYAICYETVPDPSLKTSFVTRHLETKHVDLKHKRLEYFQRNLPDMSSSKLQTVSFFRDVLLIWRITRAEKHCTVEGWSWRYGQFVDMYMSLAPLILCDLGNLAHRDKSCVFSRTAISWRHSGDIDRYWYVRVTHAHVWAR